MHMMPLPLPRDGPISMWLTRPFKTGSPDSLIMSPIEVGISRYPPFKPLPPYLLPSCLATQVGGPLCAHIPPSSQIPRFCRELLGVLPLMPPIEEYRKRLFPHAPPPTHHSCYCGLVETREHILHHCTVFLRKSHHEMLTLKGIISFLIRNPLAFKFRDDDTIPISLKRNADEFRINELIGSFTKIKFKHSKSSYIPTPLYGPPREPPQPPPDDLLDSLMGDTFNLSLLTVWDPPSVGAFDKHFLNNRWRTLSGLGKALEIRKPKGREDWLLDWSQYWDRWIDSPSGRKFTGPFNYRSQYFFNRTTQLAREAEEERIRRNREENIRSTRIAEMIWFGPSG